MFFIGFISGVFALFIFVLIVIVYVEKKRAFRRNEVLIYKKQERCIYLRKISSIHSHVAFENGHKLIILTQDLARPIETVIHDQK